MKKIVLVAALSATAVLYACGGGGGSDTPTPAGGATNPFTAMVGTYSTGCGPDGATGSDITIVTISAPVGADKATISAQSKSFTGSTTCADAAKDFDLTVNGELTALAATKTITGSGKTGKANTVAFKYSGLKLSGGSLNMPIPAAGTTSTGGYLLEGNKLYVLSGSRGADGLPDSFSSGVYVKQ
jgi:hypothetical protein